MSTTRPTPRQEWLDEHRHCRSALVRNLALYLVVLAVVFYAAYHLVRDARNASDLAFGRGFQECMTQFKEP